jgi:hypothetical protein
VASLPEDERAVLSSLGVSSILSLLLFVDGAWQGFLGFWIRAGAGVSKEDIRSLETVADGGVYSDGSGPPRRCA